MSRFFGALCLLLVATACATTPATDPAETRFVVVRHAEKAADDPRDPSLSESGRQRAAALAADLHRAPVVAVYASGFRRTQQTAAPVAADHDLSLRAYDAAQPAAQFAADLRRRHRHGTVVVVGHSNTVPAIVSALCGCPVAAIDEADYGHRYTVRIGADGRATMEHEHD